MKKLLLPAILSLSILCGCSTYSYPYAASAESCCHDGWVYEIEDFHIYYTPVGGEKTILCFDPLCDHGDYSGCPSTSWGGRTSLAVTEDEDGTPVVFFTHENMNLDSFISTWQIRRMNTKDNKVEVLADLTEKITEFRVYGDKVYFTQPEYETDENGNRSSVGCNIYTLSLKTNKIEKLTDFRSRSVSIAAISDGRIWWTDADEMVMYVSPADFSESETVVEGVPLYGSFIEDGWLYYPQKTGRTIDGLEGEPHPKERAENINDNGTVTLFYPADEWEYVRMNLDNGTTEAVCGGVCQSTYENSSLLIDGDFAYYIPYAPTYIDAIAANAAGLTGDFVESESSRVQVDYITADSGEKIVKKNLLTGESVEIPTPGYDVHGLLGLSDGGVIADAYVTDTAKISERLAEEGVHSGSFTFSEIVRIDVE